MQLMRFAVTPVCPLYPSNAQNGDGRIRIAFIRGECPLFFGGRWKFHFQWFIRRRRRRSCGHLGSVVSFKWFIRIDCKMAWNVNHQRSDRDGRMRLIKIKINCSCAACALFVCVCKEGCRMPTTDTDGFQSEMDWHFVTIWRLNAGNK